MGCFARPWNQAYLLKPYSTCSRTWEGKKCASTYINCQHVIFYILSVNTQLKQCSLMICSLDSTRSWITLQILNNFSHIFTYRVPNISIVSLVQFSFKNESSSRHMALLWACKKNTLLPKKRTVRSESVSGLSCGRPGRASPEEYFSFTVYGWLVTTCMDATVTSHSRTLGVRVCGSPPRHLPPRLDWVRVPALCN